MLSKQKYLDSYSLFKFSKLKQTTRTLAPGTTYKRTSGLGEKMKRILGTVVPKEKPQWNFNLLRVCLIVYLRCFLMSSNTYIYT